MWQWEVYIAATCSAASFLVCACFLSVAIQLPLSLSFFLASTIVSLRRFSYGFFVMATGGEGSLTAVSDDQFSQLMVAIHASQDRIEFRAEMKQR